MSVINFVTLQRCRLVARRTKHEASQRAQWTLNNNKVKSKFDETQFKLRHCNNQQQQQQQQTRYDLPDDRVQTPDNALRWPATAASSTMEPSTPTSAQS